MAGTGNALYAHFLVSAFEGAVKLGGATHQTFKMALLKTTYTAVAGLKSHVHYSTISGEEITGTGYTAGGATLATPTLTLTAANTWSVARASTTTYPTGAFVRPVTVNGYLYRAAHAGKSGSTVPTFPTITGETVADGTVEWTCCGADILVWTSGDATWNTATFTASYGAIYASLSTATTSPLVRLLTFSPVLAPSAGTEIVLPNASSGWFAFSPPS